MRNVVKHSHAITLYMAEVKSKTVPNVPIKNKLETIRNTNELPKLPNCPQKKKKKNHTSITLLYYNLG